jgi:hypothetical protein
MIKQIYDKHKLIWWEHVNVSQNMTQDDFIWLHNIRGGVGVYTPILQFQFNLRFSNIWRMCFFSKMFVKSMGLKFHSPTQCESILSYGHNGAIFMDATFGTNDTKFHLFTLMGFDDHCMSVLLVWIITSS